MVYTKACEWYIEWQRVNKLTFNTSAFTVCISFWCNEKWPFRFENTHTKSLLAKRSLTKMTTRCHSLWLVVTCSHSLSLVARLVVTSCHSLYTTCCHSLSLDISAVCVFISNPRKTSTDQKKHLRVLYKMNHLTIMKMFKENLKSCFSKRNLWLY